MKFVNSKIFWEEKIIKLRKNGCPKCGASEKQFIIPPHGGCVISMCQNCRWDILDDEHIPETE